jgi:hypothetical protein
MPMGCPMQVSEALSNNFVDKRILCEFFACILIRIAYLEQYGYRAPEYAGEAETAISTPP